LSSKTDTDYPVYLLTLLY